MTFTSATSNSVPIGREARVEDQRREIYSAGLFRAHTHGWHRTRVQTKKKKKLGLAAGAAALQIIMFMPKNGDSAHRSLCGTGWWRYSRLVDVVDLDWGDGRLAVPARVRVRVQLKCRCSSQPQPTQAGSESETHPTP
jgi:hypothetical protein